MFSHFYLAPLPDPRSSAPMILHQHITPGQIANHEPWWVVDLVTLTLFLCQQHSRSRYDLAHSPHPVESPAVTTTGGNGSLDEARLRVRMDVQRNFPTAGNVTTHNGTNEGDPPPEWILLNSLDGTAPSVMHTMDPVFVALADPATGTLLAPEHFSSSVDLTPEGWAYWWEDAQRAFETLAVESAAAHGIAVPDAIRSQV